MPPPSPSWHPRPARPRPPAETDSERAGACLRAAGITPLHERAQQNRHRAYVACETWGDIAAGYAHERTPGRTEASRPASLTWDPEADQAVLATARRIIRDLWARPTLTPQEAGWIADRACGWPVRL